MMGLLAKIGNVIAIPDHGPTQFALEPHRAPLRRPMMWVPNLVSFLDRRRKPQHIKISTDKQGSSERREPAATHFSDSERLTDFWETVQLVICRGIENHLMPVLSQ